MMTCAVTQNYRRCGQETMEAVVMSWIPRIFRVSLHEDSSTWKVPGLSRKSAKDFSCRKFYHQTEEEEGWMKVIYMYRRPRSPIICQQRLFSSLAINSSWYHFLRSLYISNLCLMNTAAILARSKCSPANEACLPYRHFSLSLCIHNYIYINITGNCAISAIVQLPKVVVIWDSYKKCQVYYTAPVRLRHISQCNA